MTTQVHEGPVDLEAAQDARMVGRLKAVSTVLLLILAATSFAAGVPGLLAAGEAARLGGLAWLVPIVVDGGLVFFAASAMAWRAETAKASPLGWTMVGLLTAISIAAQVVHVIDGVAAVPTVAQLVGASVAAMFPLLVLASTRQFEMLRFGRVIEREAVRVALQNKVQHREQEEAAKQALTAARARKATTQTVAPAKVVAPVQDVAMTERAVDVAVQGAEPEAVVREWIVQAEADGNRPTAAAVAERLDRSRATGLRFLNKVLADVAAARPRLEAVNGEPRQVRRA